MLRSLWDLNSPTRNQTQGQWQWEHQVLTTELPGIYINWIFVYTLETFIENFQTLSEAQLHADKVLWEWIHVRFFSIQYKICCHFNGRNVTWQKTLLSTIIETAFQWFQSWTTCSCYCEKPDWYIWYLKSIVGRRCGYEWQGGLITGYKETLAARDTSTSLILVMGFTYTVKLIRLYTLSVCSLLYVYYTTVKLGVK